MTEYIQGPCKENQHALIQDNFLDLASNLFGIDEIMDDLNIQIKKVYYLHNFTLNSLYLFLLNPKI